MNYIGIDGNIHSDELMHYKYIKKIGNRYFYTQDALRAYYEAQKGVANAEYVKDRGGDKIKQANRRVEMARYHDANLRSNYNGLAGPALAEANKREHARYRREKRLDRGVDKTVDTYRKAKREVKPVAKTAKRAVTPVASAKKAEEYVDRLVNGTNVTLNDIRKKKKEIEWKTAKKISKNQAQHRRVSSKENRQIYKERNQYKPAARW